MLRFSAFFVLVAVISAPGLSAFEPSGILPKTLLLSSFGLFTIASFANLKTSRSRWIRLPQKLVSLNGLIFYSSGLYIALQVLSLAIGIASKNNVAATASKSILISIIIVCLVNFFYQRKDPRFRGSSAEMAILAVAILCAVNFFGWIIGLKSPGAAANPATSEPASVLALLKIDVTRVYFPFSWGVNNFGMPAGLVLTYGLARLIRREPDEKIRSVHFFVYIIIPLLCILLTDTRASLVAAILSVLLAKYRFRFGIFALFLCISTIIVLSTLKTGLDLGETSKVFSRESSETGIFTGREIIWLQALLELQNFKLQHLCGYGSYGQFASGVSKGYASFLQGFGEDSDLTSLHNGALQTVLDTGYVGLLLLLLSVSGIYVSFTQKKDVDSFGSYIGLAILNFMVIQSLTEISMTYYVRETYIVLICLMFWATRRSFFLSRSTFSAEYRSAIKSSTPL